jgi:hypothetical protein
MTKAVSHSTPMRLAELIRDPARPIDPIEAFGLELGRLINERNAI